VGATQMLTAIAHPLHLAGICPIVTASNYHENWTYQGGAFEQWFNQSWTSGPGSRYLRPCGAKKYQCFRRSMEAPLATYPLFNFSDPAPAPISTATLAPYFLDWLAHPTYDQYWKQISIEEHFGDINVPVLSIAAWYGIFPGGSLRNYIGIKAHGGSEAARKGQHFYVTIGGHAGGGRKIGEVDFGPAAAEYDDNELILKWYDYLFKGVQNEFAGKPVKIFVMGSNQWREEDDWPSHRAPNTSCIRRKARTRFAETAVCRPHPHDRNRRTTISMILRIPCLRPAALYVAIRNTWRLVPAISVRSRRATTF
jgi:uncharacterized protein